MKKICAVILLTALLLLPSCKADGPENTPDADIESVILDDVATADISASFDAVLVNSAKLTAVDDDYVNGMMGIDLSGVDEYILKIQTSGTEIDSYGIFRIAKNEENSFSDSSVDMLKTTVSEYINTLKANWEGFNYLPEEMPKLESAKILQKGRYVVFVIASSDEIKAVEEVFENILTA